VIDMKYKETDTAGEHFKFFSNVECEYFPCHKTADPANYNCLFCFCPAYALGDKCGGNFRYDNEQGIKDCSDCTIPHQRDSYDFISEKAKEIVQKIKIK
jgi:Zn-finger protein